MAAGANAGGGRFVATTAIRSAVKGHETEILDALGIPWRNGRPHIHCPYPDHDDENPSWQWNLKKDRAFCTCIPKSDGIFDVVMKIKAIDFEAAKIAVAELLHRHDLIRQKGAGTGTGEKTDAASLLNPPAGQRDDGLPPVYVAARLEIDDVSAVPMPSTKAVGWKALGYYDPPPKNGGKPKLVASPPCAVFETIAADERHHAHRIYLADDGRGKAELGTMPSGKARDAKKSARVLPGQPSTAGCVVAWGNPDVDHVVVTEGIETACSIAYAFKDEIAAGELAVLSAISAVGIEAFAPWPNTTQLTIAADRDEGKPGRGFKRGEKAARNLGLRLALDGGRQIRLLVALPGQPGASVDFLDVLRAEGAEGVRKTILAAQPFQPTPEEIEEFKNRGARKTELERVNHLYPLPALVNMRVEYRHLDNNEVWLHKFVAERFDKDTGEPEQVWEPVSSPFGNLVLMSNLGPQPAYGLRIHIQTLEGPDGTVDILRADLPKLGASGIRSELMGAGLRVANGGEITIVDILKQARPATGIGATAAAGWHPSNDDVFLILGGEQW